MPRIAFPWHYFDGPTDSGIEALARWIFTEFSERAYQGFLQQGRGLLVGPFLTNGSRDMIDSATFVAQRSRSEAIGMTVVYVAANSATFERTLPDAALRELLTDAIGRYEPTRECVVLMLADNVPYAARIVGSTSPIRMLDVSASRSAAVN